MTTIAGGVAMPRIGSLRKSRYQPIADFLAMQDTDRLTLSIAQIEELIGLPLPNTAYVSTTHWRGTTSKAARTWTPLGWEAVRLDRYVPAVSFRRLAKE
jgi:hypothetical protein